MKVRICFLLSLCTVCFRVPARANDDEIISGDYVHRIGEDAVFLPVTAARWMKRHWLLTAGFCGVGAAIYSMDAESREDFGSQQLHGRHDHFSRAVKPFGDIRYLGPMIAGAWIGGMATGSPTLKSIAADGLEANLLATGFVTPAIGFLAGRNRPYNESSSLDFSPLHAGRTSFPSGHTTAAFATAAVIDSNLRAKWGYWQTPIVYSVASAVGVSRVYDQKHHPSDVMMGAVIGSAIGYWVAGRPRHSRQDLSWDLEPNGAHVNYKFGKN